MKIENLTHDHQNHRTRLSMTVHWEDSDHPPREFFYETDAAFAGALAPNPHAFVIAGAIAALHRGEKRVAVDGSICPELREGLMTSMGWLCRWYRYHGKPPALEAPARATPPHGRTSHRAGFFYSGGIDSLATLAANHRHYPAEHPGRIHDGILVYGLEVDDPEAFTHVLSSNTELAGDAGITLVPVSTNIRDLVDDWTFWEEEFEGAVFASIAHALAGRFSSVSLSSTHDIPYSHPYGSHPLLDPNYSSSDLRVRHECMTLSRLERTRLLADWPAALRHLRVCNKIEHYRAGRLNCCRCEKCMRTMLALMVLGKLADAPAFAVDEVTPDMIRDMDELNDTSHPFYPELVPLLNAMGRRDLVAVIDEKISRYHRTKWRRSLKPRFRGLVTEMDGLFLKGRLRRFRDRFAPRKSGPALLSRQEGLS